MDLARISYRRYNDNPTEWVKQDQYEKTIVYTDVVGYIIYEDDETIAIAQSRSPIEETGEVIYSGVVTIPTSLIEVKIQLEAFRG